MRPITQRERVLLGSAASVLAGVAVWTLVLAPALTTRTDSFAQLRKIDVIWAILDRLPEQLNAPQPDRHVPLRQRVTASAQAAAVEIRRLDPQGTALSVSLDEVPFAALIGWLETLTTQAGIQVRSAEIGRWPEPGLVTARIVMENAP